MRFFHTLWWVGTLLSPLCLSVTACHPKAKQQEKADGPSDPAFDQRGIESFDDFVPVERADSSLDAAIEQSAQDEDLNVVLSQCGIDDLSDNSRQTFATVMKYTYTRVINAGIAIAEVGLTSVLNLKGTLGETTLDVGVIVGALKGRLVNGDVVSDTTAIAKRAEFLASTFRGPVTSYSAPRNANFSKDWKGILCSISAADRLKNSRGGFVTEVNFTPPYAPAVSPIASGARYIKELGDYRIFREIKAQVTQTTNPLLVAGKTYEGSIIVEKIPPIRETARGRVQGDTAYRITNRFGSDAETLALGFHLWTEYYIDHSQKAFSAVIANVGDEDIMYFIGSYKGTGAPVMGPLNYVDTIAGILSKNCNSCHNASSSSRKNFVGYANAKAYATLIRDRVVAGTMPPNSPLGSMDQQAIVDWVKNGLPER